MASSIAYLVVLIMVSMVTVSPTMAYPIDSSSDVYDSDYYFGSSPISLPQCPSGGQQIFSAPPPMSYAGSSYSGGQQGANGQMFSAGAVPPPQPAPAGGQKLKYPKGDARNCLIDNPSLKIMQVVPGIGWDNLRNLELGLITSFSYSQCKTTYDKVYLIPDSTFSIPQKYSYVERQAEVFDHWDDWQSATASSINVGFDLFGKIGGKFSNEYRSVKAHQYNSHAFSMRIEIRHKLYTIKQLPDSPLQAGLKKRLLEIASLLKSNDSTSANYRAELLIRDYGTHFLSSVDAGALLVQEDSIKRSYKNDFSGSSDQFKAGIGLDFTELIGVPLNIGAGGGYSHSDSKINGYRRNRSSSNIVSYGGPPFRLGMNISEWEQGIANNLVAIDRMGRPLYTLISSQNMQPEIMESSDVLEVRELIKKVTAFYYGYNTHIGCTDPSAKNFDYEANLSGEGACDAPASNHTFGGVFQKCTGSPKVCKDLYQKNPKTGGYSCSREYIPVLLFKASKMLRTTKRDCKKEKHCTLWVFNCKHIDKCKTTPSVEFGTYETYWCTPKSNKTQGYLFGGLFSDDFKNPITRQHSCPPHFVELKFGESAMVCISDDYELGNPFSLNLGGFFSCQSGNPMALSRPGNSPKKWPRSCPAGFTQHLGMIDRNCQINFCVKAGELKHRQDLEIILPPFENNPIVLPNSTSDLFNSAGSPPPMFSSGYPQGGTGYGGNASIQIGFTASGQPCYLTTQGSPQQQPQKGDGDGALSLQPLSLLITAAAMFVLLYAL